MVYFTSNLNLKDYNMFISIYLFDINFANIRKGFLK